MISLLIYDISHKLLFNLKEGLEKENIEVYGCNTDCVYIENNEDKLKSYYEKNKDLFEFEDKNSFEALGKIKVENKILPNRQVIPMRHLINYYEKVVDVKINLIELKDEWDRKEINSKIERYNNLIIKADIAGAGKTSSFINYKEVSCKNILFIVPWNSLKFDLKSKSLNAIILDKLKGIRWDGEDNKETGKSYDVEEYDAVVFDEIYLYPTYKLKLIQEFMNENKDKRFYARESIKTHSIFGN